ncbi:MAG: type II toxin-antitoxin system MqsA family antitoxin [Nitrososphaerales archaeon]
MSQEEKVVRKVMCPICGGRTTMKRVSVTESAGKRLVLIKKVEAEVCSQCGERMYSENTMQKLDSLMRKVKAKTARPEARTQVEVYALNR